MLHMQPSGVLTINTFTSSYLTELSVIKEDMCKIGPLIKAHHVCICPDGYGTDTRSRTNYRLQTGMDLNLDLPNGSRTWRAFTDRCVLLLY